MSHLVKFVTADGISTVVPMSGEWRRAIQRAISYYPPPRVIDWAKPADALSVRVPVRTYEYYGAEHDPERGELLVYRERYDAGGSR